MAAPEAWLDFSAGPPELVVDLRSEFLGTPNNFVKCVRFSPDGVAVLVNSDDNQLRVVDVPPDALERPCCTGLDDGAEGDVSPALCIPGGECVHDCCWWPCASALDPASFVFLSSPRAHPLQLLDGVTGRLRATYRAHDAVDEVTAAVSCCFSGAGDLVCGGYDRCVRLFSLERPGRECSTVAAKALGLVTCLAAGPEHLLAAGGTGKGVALLDTRGGGPTALLHGHRGAVVHARFSPCGNFLYTAARRDDAILCWDVRSLGDSGAVFSLSRGGSGDTNQRMAFDIEPGGRHLAVGGTDGCVRAFDLQNAAQVCAWRAGADAVAGFAYNPAGLPMAASGSGCRVYAAEGDQGVKPTDSAVRLWRWRRQE